MFVRQLARVVPRALLAVPLAAIVAVLLVGTSGAAFAQTAPGSVCDVIHDPALRQQCQNAVASATIPSVPLTLPAIPSGIEQIGSYDAAIQVQPDGILVVRETIGYDFGVVPKHGIFRDIPVRFDYPKKTATDRVYPLTVVSVSGSANTPAQYTTDTYDSNGIGYLRIKIGDPNRTIVGQHTYKIVYRVRGALNGFTDHDELVWNAVGNQWTVPIQAVTVAVSAPANIIKVNCNQGPFGSSQPCDTSKVSGNVAAFTQGSLSPNSGLTVTVAIPPGAVPPPNPILEQRWTLTRAFAVTAITGPVAGGLLALFVIAFLAYMWRTGRDSRYRGSAVDQAFGSPGGSEERTPLLHHEETPVEFEPPDGLRPGQVGTLVAFRAHPLDVTATIIDLAVRKYLRIEEIDPQGHWAKKDWRLTKLKDPDAGLKPYEQDLLKALFKGKDDNVRLSDLRDHFATSMDKVQKELGDDAMEQGWFRRRPQDVWFAVGAVGVLLLIAGIAVTAVLAATTHAGLIGIPIVILGLLVTIGARWAPARTAKGSAVLRRVNGFRRFINESEMERARFAEKKNLFSEYLPYAIVFGATQKWAKAFAGLDGQPADVTYWYVSAAAFDYAAFSSSMTGFTVTAAGTLTSTPASTSGSSGFSGGGFSGGGGGGGGGGSW